MKKKSTARIPLAIYRIKDSFKDSVFRSDADLTSDGAKVQRTDSSFAELGATVIVRTPREKEPSWKAFISTIAPEIETEIVSRTSQSAAVEFQLGPSRYAVTFGHGRMLIAPEAIERRFGLRCALDLISEESMISVGYKQVDHTTLFSNIQANRRVGFESFHVDTESSILNGVVGRPAKDDPMYNKALGGDALHLNPRIRGDEAGLLDFVTWVDCVYHRKGYMRKGYEWIDQISLVKDPGRIASLEADLNTELISGPKSSNSQLWFAPPGIVDYDDIETLIVQGTRGKRMREVTISAIRKARGKMLSVADLKKAYIRGHDASGNRVMDWRAFEWLNWETSSGGDSVILQGGDYYLIDKSFERRIDRHLGTLTSIPSGYPDWLDRKNDKEAEEVYNKKLTRTLKRGKCLDKKTFTKSFQGHGALELCDVLVKGETAKEPTTLVFVKKYSESSPALSHLFAQGPNSIETILRDEGFRKEIRDKVKGVTQVFPQRAPKPSALGMTFVILTKNVRREVPTLPFFSKLSLYRAATWAETRGITVSVGTRAMKVF